MLTFILQLTTRYELDMDRWASRARPAVLGAVDGIVTTFAVLVSGDVTGVDQDTIVVVALATMLADAVSMTVGEYLSSKATSGWREAVVNALICGTCFVASGAVPILASVVDGSVAAVAAVFASMLILLGGVRGLLTTVSVPTSIVEVSLLGSAAGAVCYGASHMR